VIIHVAIQAGDFQAAAEYTLATLLDAAGLPFAGASSPHAHSAGEAILLRYGADRPDLAGGVIIPADDPALWRQGEPDFVSVEGVPALHAGEAPVVLFHEQGATIQAGFDLVRAAWWLLSRQEELGIGNQDSFGRFDCSASWLLRRGLAETPLVNLYAGLLAQLLTKAAAQQGLPLLVKLPWPEGRPYAVVASHDVDDAGRFDVRQGLRLMAKSFAQRAPRGMARGAYYATAGLGRSLSRQADPYWNFETVMRLEQEAGFRSTFFFVPATLSADRDPPYEIDTPRLRDLLKRLHGGGWEVGVHGSFDSYLDAEALSAQRHMLARSLGTDVFGVRQHYLRRSVPATFYAQSEAGFVYDSTLGYRGAVGFRAGAAFPFRPLDPFTDQVVSLLELPLTVMDGPLFWQLGLTPQHALERTLKLLETTRSVSGLAVLLWHQRVCHQKKYPGWWWVYEQVVQHLHAEGVAWVPTAGQVAGWWLAREALHLEEILVEGDLRRWRFRAGRALAGLTLALAGAGRGWCTVVGAEVAIKRMDGERIRLDLGSLAAGQSFEVLLTPRGAVP
jgi:peptidoglycan/xylan/chitin deacetylase (PgdA/CDA1 family)